MGNHPSSNPGKSAFLRNYFRRHRIGIFVFITFWLSFGYFYHLQTGWNANSRFDLTLSIVNYGTLSIDHYHDAGFLETNDKAYYDGHFYSDKSPALSFIAVPFYAIVRPIVYSFSSQARIITSYHWTTFWTVGLLGALAAAMFYRVMRGFGANNKEALMLVFFLIYGTNLGGYTSLFYPYLPATCCMVGAYLLLLQSRIRGSAISAWRAASIGFLISMAGFFEFTFGLAGIILLGLTFITMRPRGKFVYTIAGALPPVAALFTYNYVLFGSFSLPYEYEYLPIFREGMAQGFMGITSFKPSVLYFITIHPFKGIFFYSPMLLFFILGSLWVKRLGKWGADLLAAWAIVIAYLIFNASYYMWWGGWSMGARHLIPMLPFMFLPILAAMRRHAQLGTVVVLAGILSVALNFPAIATDPQIPPGIADDFLWNPPVGHNIRSVWLLERIPRFYVEGDVAINPFMRLPHLWSIAPLVILWLLGLGKAWRTEETSGA